MYSLDWKTYAITLWLVIATPVLVIGEEATPALSRNEALNSQLDILASNGNEESDPEAILGSGSGEMDPLSNTGELLDNPVYFEGDLNIPRAQIMEAYHPPAASNVRKKRGAINERRWPGGIIYYNIHSSVSCRLRKMIINAIAVYERETCLQFRAKIAPNCIQFTALGSGCSSDSVGRKGGIQTITLPGRCDSQYVIIHEIGHAIGLWHEQSRPDRNLYVTIHWDNIQSEACDQFHSRDNIDYQGEQYDYGSVMHYRDDQYSLNGRKTITRKGSAESISPSSTLSESDIKQINRMYDCPEASPGFKGKLGVKMIQARDLPDTDWWWYNPDPYAVVVAVDKSNNRHIKSTGVKSGTRYPQWNEELYFGYSSVGWRYFTITIYDRDDYGGDDDMIGTQTIWVNPNCTTNTRRFCKSVTQCVEYNFRLEDVDNCRSNPCGRGTCQDRVCDFYCSCPTHFRGKTCTQYRPPRKDPYENGLPSRQPSGGSRPGSSRPPPGTMV